jgi:hypothetical protein
MELLRPRLPRELGHPLGPGRDLRIELDLGGAAAQDLGAVVAHVGDRAERHDPPRGTRAAPGHAGHEPVALGDRDEQHARRLGHVRVVRVADDRREHAVDVEQHSAAARIGAQRLEMVGQGRGSGHEPSVSPLLPFTASRRE